MEVTLPGITILVKLLQKINAPAEISVNPVVLLKSRLILTDVFSLIAEIAEHILPKVSIFITPAILISCVPLVRLAIILSASSTVIVLLSSSLFSPLFSPP